MTQERDAAQNPTMDQALALAGVAQFALYAHELATQGYLPAVRLQRALNAIFCTEPDTAAEIFDGVAGVADGRRFLRAQLGSNMGRTNDKGAAVVSRYIGQILRLCARLRKDTDALTRIARGIDQARLLNNEQAPRVLDETYRETISRIKPRIMIRGQQNHLNNPRSAEQLRTLLMAAVRCGILWRQSGGSFWRLLLQRQRLAAALSQLS